MNPFCFVFIVFGYNWLDLINCLPLNIVSKLVSKYKDLSHFICLWWSFCFVIDKGEPQDDLHKTVLYS